MLECNHCERYNCPVPERLRRERDWKSMRKHCKIHIKPKPFVTTLFELAMDKNPQGVYDSLESLGMRVVEQRKYPWFRVVPAEEG